MNASSPRAPGHSSRNLWILILVLLTPAVVLPLVVPIYNREDPTLFGFPFYYWFQFALIIIAVALTVPAFLLSKRVERIDRARHGLPPEPPVVAGPEREDGDHR